MRKINEDYPVIQLGNKVYTLPCTLNVLEDICIKFNGFDEMLDTVKDTKAGMGAIKSLTGMLINEGIKIDNFDNQKSEPLITEWEVGRYITLDNLSYVSEIIMNAIMESMPQSASDELKNRLAALTQAN